MQKYYVVFKPSNREIISTLEYLPGIPYNLQYWTPKYRTTPFIRPGLILKIIRYAKP
jgi:hypothetical protein